MKIKIWPADTSMLEMNDWLAELRDRHTAIARAARATGYGGIQGHGC